jgi:serine/threonine-protein kinase RsbW
VAELPNVRLHLSNRPENVLLVRQALNAMAEPIGLDGVTLNDIATAVTEACNNVVLHAYGSEEGPLDVEVFCSAGAIEATVRDRGAGIPAPLATAPETAAGIGLPVIRALARHVELGTGAENGTEVRMEFATPGIRPLQAGGEKRFEPPPLRTAELATTTWLTLTPLPLARAVLPRLLCVLAARAHFSTDRISDAELLADVLLAEAPELIGPGRLDVAVSVKPRDLELRIGPLRSGGARPTVHSALDGLGSLIEQLTSHRAVARIGSSEMLELRLNDAR